MNDTELKIWIIDLIKQHRDEASEAMNDCRSEGINSPGFNQEMGAFDALNRILGEIEGDQ